MSIVHTGRYAYNCGGQRRMGGMPGVHGKNGKVRDAPCCWVAYAFRRAFGLEPLRGTQPLELQGDIPMQMVAGIRRVSRPRFGRKRRETRGTLAYERLLARSVREHRLRRCENGCAPSSALSIRVTRRTWRQLEDWMRRYLPSADRRSCTASGGACFVEWKAKVCSLSLQGPCTLRRSCCWTVTRYQRGLMPQGSVSGFANSPVLRLAAVGCRVIVPLLIDRSDEFSGTTDLRMTNQPHREFIYRTGHEVGRHIIGYEVQKVLVGGRLAGSERPGTSYCRCRLWRGRLHRVVFRRRWRPT